MTSKPAIVALTPGEPAGVGPDLSIQLAQEQSAHARNCALVIVGNAALLTERARELGTPFAFQPWNAATAVSPGIYVLNVDIATPATAGTLDPRNAAYVIETLTRAADGCLRGEFDALVTGPVQKSVINDAGIPFTGHTEFLAQRAGCALPVMLLASADLRVALATTHLPLAQVSRHITRELLTRVLQTLQHDLIHRFHIETPRILVCGLNPHAGEGGHLGREEIDVIEPAVRACADAGMRVVGPVPADTAFTPARLAECDAVLAMYHDQGLPVIKHHDFAGAVNVTLGLPFIRTSVDHGTALDLAGSGRADASSLRAALTLALRLVRPS